MHRTMALTIASLAVLGLSAPARADVPKGVEDDFNAIVAALQKGDYDAFIAHGDAAFRAPQVRAAFDSAARAIGPKLATGFKTKFLTKLNKHAGYVAYVWKIEFADKQDDVLGILSIKDGLVGGFFLQ
jgi:hypothetical protein